MRRIEILCVVCCTFAGLAFAAQGPGAQNADMQQQAAAAREAAARNQQALQHYSWVSTTRISVDGDVKNTKVEQCRYGSDGKVQKTELAQEQAQQQSRGRGRRGRIVKKAVVAEKSSEMQDEMQSAAALVQSYVPPSPDKIQAVVAAGGVSQPQSPDGSAVIRFENYEKEGDALTLTLDADTKAMLAMSVETWLDDPGQAVTLNVQFEKLADGTSYAATTVLAIPGDKIEVHIDNDNYERQDR